MKKNVDIFLGQKWLIPQPPPPPYPHWVILSLERIQFRVSLVKNSSQLPSPPSPLLFMSPQISSLPVATKVDLHMMAAISVTPSWWPAALYIYSISNKYDKDLEE